MPTDSFRCWVVQGSNITEQRGVEILPGYVQLDTGRACSTEPGAFYGTVYLDYPSAHAAALAYAEKTVAEASRALEHAKKNLARVQENEHGL